MKNMTCNEIQGAMYGFPQIRFSHKAIKRAEKLNVLPDFMYCMDLLKETGIMTVPGSGFGQKDGTYHLRVTNLVCPTDEMSRTMEKMSEFNDKFHDKYQ
jgi:alanine transaminase